MRTFRFAVFIFWFLSLTLAGTRALRGADDLQVALAIDRDGNVPEDADLCPQVPALFPIAHTRQYALLLNAMYGDPGFQKRAIGRLGKVIQIPYVVPGWSSPNLLSD